MALALVSVGGRGVAGGSRLALLLCEISGLSDESECVQGGMTVDFTPF